MKQCVEKLKNLKILDKFILSQVIEVFIMGVCVFTSIIFASDTFITLIKQITMFGIPFSVAFRIVILNLPGIIVMTIPLGVLMATVMTLNKLSLSSEITVLRSCGIGLNRIAKPIFAFSIVMALCCFVINESVVPVMSKQSKDLALWSFGQKNIPDGKENFVFKELNDSDGLKRLFYVGKCEGRVLQNVTVLDTSKEGTIQVLQALEGGTDENGWRFDKGAIYTMTSDGQVLNTSLFDKFNIKFAIDLTREMNKNIAKEMNITELIKYIKTTDFSDNVKQKNRLHIELSDKFALPITTIVLVLIGVPLSITPPRVRYNRGFLFSILIIFAYYLIRALSISFGSSGVIPPFLAAWLPNIIMLTAGGIMYYRKVYTIT